MPDYVLLKIVPKIFNLLPNLQAPDPSFPFRTIFHSSLSLSFKEVYEETEFHFTSELLVFLVSEKASKCRRKNHFHLLFKSHLPPFGGEWGC
jgi:hypothetical protein